MPGVTTAYQNGVHGSRPAANSGCILYACSTHSLIYRSDGSTWATWMTIGSSTTTVASDALWDAAGDLAVGTGADTAAKLSLTAPAANILNVLGVANGETTPTWKAIHDGTAPTTSALADVAAAGTSLLAAHRDHKHGRESYPTFHGAKVNASAAQSVNGSAVLTLNTVVFDPDSIFDDANDRLTIAITGYYFVRAHTNFAANGNWIWIRSGAAGAQAGVLGGINGPSTFVGGTAGTGYAEASVILSLTAGQVVDVQCNTSTTANVGGTAADSKTTLEAYLIGV